MESSRPEKAKAAPPRGQTAAAVLALAAVLAGCGGAPPDAGGGGSAALGGAAADEPAAALIARDALADGGTAADAAAALYFGLAATWPIAAGLGGGGVCLAHDGQTGRTEALDFTSGRPPGAAGNVDGMAALHARYGRLRWERLVQPGERAARFGRPASRAFIRASRPHAARLAADPHARRIFLRADGTALAEGDLVERPALAETLSRIRIRGAAALRRGPLARRLAAAGAASRGWRPRWVEPVALPLDGNTVWMAPESREAALWPRAAADGRETAEPPPARGGEATGFVVTDGDGGAVACALSMNGAFGTGRTIPGTGMFAAAPAAPGAPSGAALAIAAGRAGSGAVFAAAASGGPDPASALVGVAAAALADGAPLAAALAAERGEDDSRVNAVHCPDGAKRRPALCRFGADPRGFGHAVSAER